MGKRNRLHRHIYDLKQRAKRANKTKKQTQKQQQQQKTTSNAAETYEKLEKSVTLFS
jgi:hypothetical protein